jgi:hypothetical protein
LGRGVGGGDEGENTTHLEHLRSFSLIKNMKKKREKKCRVKPEAMGQP